MDHMYDFSMNIIIFEKLFILHYSSLKNQPLCVSRNINGICYFLFKLADSHLFFNTETLILRVQCLHCYIYHSEFFCILLFT